MCVPLRIWACVSPSGPVTPEVACVFVFVIFVFILVHRAVKMSTFKNSTHTVIKYAVPNKTRELTRPRCQTKWPSGTESAETRV